VNIVGSLAGSGNAASSTSSYPASSNLPAWAVPGVTAGLIAVDHVHANLSNTLPAMIAALAIIIIGIPHGALDIEVAATRFGQSSTRAKIQITTAYLVAAMFMALLWFAMPPFALSLFLIISIVHFSTDWRTCVDPFLSLMVGWTLIALPALANLDAVGAIFSLLTGDQSGAVVADLLACSAVPAVLGSAVYIGLAFKQGRYRNATDLVCCLTAMAMLPPLISFALFFCCLHSPRHLLDAVRDAGKISLRQKALIAAAVTILAIGLGVLLFVLDGTDSVDTNVIRTAFLLLSILTVPHFILEQLSDRMPMP
jgi:beta-carotene 15,15'-dioxygenase